MEKLMTLFLSYLSASLASSILILALLAAKKLWKNRLSKSWQYYIWLLVLMRLLLPVTAYPGIIGSAALHLDAARSAAFSESAENREEAGWLTRSADIEEEKGEKGGKFAPPLFAKPLADKGSPDGGQLPGQPQTGGLENLALLYGFSIAGIFWLLIAFALLLFHIARYQRAVRGLQRTCLPVSDQRVLAACRAAGEEQKLRNIPAVYLSRAIHSPLLIGVRKPCILLPWNFLPPEGGLYVFRHELHHFRRGDIVYKWLLQIAVCLHWFNPLVCLMRRECERACELSCDEAVVRHLSLEERRTYGDTLIASIKNPTDVPKSAVSLPLCENAEILKERLGAVMKIKTETNVQKTAALLATLCLAGILVLLGGFPVRAQERKKDSGPGQHADVQNIKSGESSGDKNDKFVNSTVSDGWLNDSSNPESKKWHHSFMVTGFFENQYGLRLAWNNDSALYDTTRPVTAGDVYIVSFTGETERYADNPEVLEALRLAILRQRQRENGEGSTASTWKMTNPVLVALDGPYEESFDQLAVRFYEEDEISYFPAVIENASKQTQKSVLTRAYEEENIPYFACAVEYLDSKEKADFLRRAYQGGKVAFFSILADEVEPELLEEIAAKAYQEQNTAFYHITKDALSDWEQAEYIGNR